MVTDCCGVTATKEVPSIFPLCRIGRKWRAKSPDLGFSILMTPRPNKRQNESRKGNGQDLGYIQQHESNSAGGNGKPFWGRNHKRVAALHAWEPPDKRAVRRANRCPGRAVTKTGSQIRQRPIFLMSIQVSNPMREETPQILCRQMPRPGQYGHQPSPPVVASYLELCLEPRKRVGSLARKCVAMQRQCPRAQFQLFAQHATASVEILDPERHSVVSANSDPPWQRSRTVADHSKQAPLGSCLQKGQWKTGGNAHANFNAILFGMEVTLEQIKG